MSTFMSGKQDQKEEGGKEEKKKDSTDKDLIEFSETDGSESQTTTNQQTKDDDSNNQSQNVDDASQSACDNADPNSQSQEGQDSVSQSEGDDSVEDGTTDQSEPQAGFEFSQSTLESYDYSQLKFDYFDYIQSRYGEEDLTDQSHFADDEAQESDEETREEEVEEEEGEEKKKKEEEKVDLGHDPFAFYDIGTADKPPEAKWHVKLIVKGVTAPRKLCEKVGRCCGCDISAFLWGSFISAIWFIVMWYVYSLPTSLTMIICCTIAFLLPLTMGLSQPFRAFVFLMLTGLTGQYGRSLLLIAAYSLVFQGPVQNYANNLRVYQDSVECAKEQAHNATVEKLSRMTSPDEGIFGALKRLMDNVRKMVRNIKMMYDVLLHTLRSVHDILWRAGQFLERFRISCKRITSIPYNICCDFFVVLEGWICKHFKKMNYPCRAFQKLKDYIKKKIANKMVSQFDKTKAKLWEMKMTTVHRMVMNKTVTKPFSQIGREIKAEMMRYLCWFDRVNFAMDMLYFLVLLITIIKSHLYQKKYHKVIEYDNFYITSVLYDLDEKRYHGGKETLLPLKGKEKRKYLKTTRIPPTKSECTKIKRMMIISTFVIANVLMYLLADYSLYKCLDVVSDYGSIKVVLPEAPASKISVSGTGGLASFYRELSGELNKLDSAASPPSFLNACMPKPFPPDYFIYKKIGYMCATVYIFIILDVYLQRLRHAIMGYFYPERAKKRGDWLYFRILRLRSTYGKRARRRIRKFKEKLKDAGRGIGHKLIKLCPPIRLIMKCCGFNYIFCFSCGLMFNEEQKTRYKSCESYGCPGKYCYECYEDLQKVCALCTLPIEYGDVSDVDDEKDSSGEEGMSIVQLQVALQSRFPDMFTPGDTAKLQRWPKELVEMGIPKKL